MDDLGLTTFGKAIAAQITHMGVTDGKDWLIKPAVFDHRGPGVFSASLQVLGAEFEGKTIKEVCALADNDSGAVLLRRPRRMGIGVQEGDDFTLGIVFTFSGD
jgi:hypothetical protein